MRPGLMIAICAVGRAPAGCNQATAANYRGDKADPSRASAKPPSEVAACISDELGAEHLLVQEPPQRQRGTQLALEGGSRETPVAFAVVDIEAQSIGSVARYGGRLRETALPLVERGVDDCVKRSMFASMTMRSAQAW